MAARDATDATDSVTPLLDDAFDGNITDWTGRPANKSAFGGWRSASFIIGVEFAERFAFFGIGSNMINFMTGPMGQATAAAAASINTWAGVVSLLPLLGGFLADSVLGRYCTIVICSVIYILGLGLLSLSALLPSLISSQSHSTNQLQLLLFYISLYLVAIAIGGHRPCIQAFGADQFDAQDPKESKAKSSFFNWCFFGLYTGTLVAYLPLNYIQENLSWVLGFGIPCFVMVLALAIFLLGTKTYRHGTKRNAKCPIAGIGRAFVAAITNRRGPPQVVAITFEEEAQEDIPILGSHQFGNGATDAQYGLKENAKEIGSVDELEEAKAMLRLVPIWFTSLVYAIVIEQPPTFFTKQGTTMDRSIGSSGFMLPAASLQAIISLSIVVLIPIYDRIFVPWAKAFTGRPSGITMLQRIGIGMFLSALAMAIAALVETKRLKTAREHGLIDEPSAIVPMSLWWLVPQYVVHGVSHVFTVVGLQEFFYDQVPSELKSVGLSLYLSIFGIGGFLSSFLISTIEKATGGNGRNSWFADNINRAHLDYFYWLLSSLSAVALVAYMYFAKSYMYNIRRNV